MIKTIIDIKNTYQIHDRQKCGQQTRKPVHTKYQFRASHINFSANLAIVLPYSLWISAAVWVPTLNKQNNSLLYFCVLLNYCFSLRPQMANKQYQNWSIFKSKFKGLVIKHINLKCHHFYAIFLNITPLDLDFGLLFPLLHFFAVFTHVYSSFFYVLISLH